MGAKTADETLKEYFKTSDSKNNRITVLKSRFITGTLTELSKKNLLLSLGYVLVQQELYEKMENQ